VRWTQLVNDNFGLLDNSLEQQVCEEVGIGSDALGNDAILRVPDGALRRILSMYSWSNIFYFCLDLSEEFFQEPRCFVVEALPGGQFFM
jgi:hypothetical protein